MREMKDSGVEWIGEIPKEWTVLRTKNLYANHKTIVGENACKYGRLALTLSGVIRRPKEDTNGLQPEAFDGYQILCAGELVFKLIDLENTSTSRVDLSPYTGIVSPAYIILTPNDGVNSKFGQFYYISMWQREIFNHMGDDGVRSSLNSSDLLNIPFLYPALSEQHRIADFLDKKCGQIDSILDKTRASIEEYKRLKQAVITRAVTKGISGNRPMKDSGIEWIGEIPKEWEINRIKYVSMFQPFCDSSNLNDNSIITYLPMEFIKDGFYIQNTAQYGSLATSLTAFSEGDIVQAKVTPCFENGNIAIMNNLSSKYGLGSSELFIYRAIKVTTKFLFYWLRSSVFMKKACSTMTGTGGLKRVSPFWIKNSEIPMPSKNEQRLIADYLDEKCAAIDAIIAKKQQLVTELEAYKKSLIYEYVTGKKEVV